ncbi:MAG: hypothetical protein AAB902_02490 [Patescibacteria group bacterium]
MSSEKAEKLNIYKKYYFLEDYLFKEISNNFKKNHYLTNEEFFAIIIWKRNASKTKILSGIKKSDETVKKITENLYKEKDRERKICILTKIDGIGIAIASAILTVCYPGEFTIADYRASASLKSLGYEVKGDPTTKIPVYFDYLDKCKKLTKKSDLSLRDLDRCLWGYDFYEGKNGLKELAKILK